MTVGERIKQIRKEKGLTQVELAKRLSVSQAMITQYENHQREPKKFDTIKKIASALEVSPEDILGKELVNTMREDERFEQTVHHYLEWLRGMRIMLTTPSYEDDDGEDKDAIIVDIDGVPLNIEDSIGAVMQMGVEHFKVIAKQLGKTIWGQGKNT
jgi:transcriptional regulator with XRE-family HTH domain